MASTAPLLFVSGDAAMPLKIQSLGPPLEAPPDSGADMLRCDVCIDQINVNASAKCYNVDKEEKELVLVMSW